MPGWTPRNPYLWREWQAWRLDRLNLTPLQQWQSCFALFVAMWSFWCCPFLLAFVWVTAVVVTPGFKGAYSYGNEVERGTGAIAQLTVASPWREIRARYAAVMFVPLLVWFAGLLFFLAPQVVERLHTPDQYLELLLLWGIAGAWAAFSGAVALAVSACGNSTMQSLSLHLLWWLVLWVLLCVSFSPGHPLWVSAAANPFQIPEAAAMTLSDTVSPPDLQSAAEFVAGLFILTLAALACATQAIRHNRPVSREAVGMRHASWSRLLGFTSTGLVCPPADAAPAGGRTRAEWIDSRLGSVRHDAFYRAFRNGFARRFPSRWLPGSPVPACLCLAMSLLHNKQFSVEGFIVGFFVALVVSALRAFIRTSVSLSAEYSNDRWPLLISTGLTPSDVVRGKFAAIFYALSGDWVWMAPLWFLVLFSGHPTLIALSLMHPTVIACAIAFGLAVTPEPKPEQRSEFSLARIVLVIVVGILLFPPLAVLVAMVCLCLSPVIFVAASILNPFTLVSGLSGNEYEISFTLLRLFLQVGFLAAAAGFLGLAAERHLSRSMNRQPSKG